MSGNISEIMGGGVQSAPDEHSGEFKPLPAGWYPVSVESAEIEETNAKTGFYLKLKIKVLSGHGANRVIFPMINMRNPNQKAEEIGQRQLAALGDACGIPSVSDTDQFLGKNLDVRLKIEPAKGNYSEDNKVQEYAKLGTKSSEDAVERPAYPQGPQQPAPAHSPPGQPAATQAPAKTGGMPWDR